MKRLKLTNPKRLVKPKFAVAASGTNLLNNEHGEIIDGFSEVVGFNRGPTKGYEKHVGSKTTIRIANNHVFGHFPHVGSETDAQPTVFVKEQKNVDIVYRGPGLTHWADKAEHVDASSKAFQVEYGELYKTVSPLTNRNSAIYFYGYVLTVGLHQMFLAMN